MKKSAQLSLLETTIKELGYKLRYEKGNFQSGECRLYDNKIVVINKFLPIEGKIYTLAHVIDKLAPSTFSIDVEKIISAQCRQRSLFQPVENGSI